MNEIEDVFRLLVASEHQFRRFADEVRTQPRVGEVRMGLELRHYATASVIEAFVDATRTDGRSICWWLELRSQEGGWIVEAKVLLSDSDGQDVLEEFPEARAETVGEAVVVWNVAASRLIASDAWLSRG